MTTGPLCSVSGCAGSTRRPALEGLTVCSGCRAQFRRDLAAIPALYEACERALTRPRPAGAPVTGRPSYGIALNAAAIEVRTDVLEILASWCDLVVAGRLCTAPARTVVSAAEFLARHLGWLCAHPAASDAVTEIAQLAQAALRAAYPAGARKVRVGRCVEAGCGGGLLAVLRDDDDQRPSEVRCDTDGSHLWPVGLWWKLDGKVTRAPRDRWLSVTDVTALWGLSVSNVYRLASENGWRRRRLSGRVYYAESDVHASVAQPCGERR